MHIPRIDRGSGLLSAKQRYRSTTSGKEVKTGAVFAAANEFQMRLSRRHPTARTETQRRKIHV